MTVSLRGNILLQSFQTRTELMRVILTMISQGKTDQILFKGDVSDLGYKLMKKIVLLKGTHTPEEVRASFSTSIESAGNAPYCLIYRDSPITEGDPTDLEDNS